MGVLLWASRVSQPRLSGDVVSRNHFPLIGWFEEKGSSNQAVQAWRDGSAFMSTDCFSREPRFNSRYPYDDSQLSVTPGSNQPVCIKDFS